MFCYPDRGRGASSGKFGTSREGRRIFRTLTDETIWRINLIFKADAHRVLQANGDFAEWLNALRNQSARNSLRRREPHWAQRGFAPRPGTDILAMHEAINDSSLGDVLHVQRKRMPDLTTHT